MKESLSERIDRLIKSKGLSITEFSQAIGVSHSTISRVLKGTQTPNVDTLLKASQFFKISMEELYIGDVAHDLSFENSFAKTKLPLDILHMYELLEDKDKNEVHDYIKYRYVQGLKETKSSASQNGKKATTGSRDIG